MGISSAVGKTSAAAVSLGGSFAVNVLDRETRAYISSSEVTSAGEVDLESDASGTIWAMTIGGVGSGASSETGFGGALSVAGAGRVNVIDSDVESYIY